MKNKLLTFLALHLGLVAVMAQPFITCQPSNQTAIAGSTVTFTVCATGAPPLSYQWRSYANSTTFTNIPWGTEATLVLTNAQPTSRRFGVVVTDAGGLSVTSSPLVTLTVVFPPRITQEPASQFAEVGDTIAINVSATGTPPLSYQWQLNGQSLAGQTRSNLTWISVQLSNAGTYSVVITNSYGSITRQVATLMVVPPIFTKITNGSIVAELGTGVSCAWGDYDDDGFIDLIVTSAYNPVTLIPQTNILFHNDRDGSFTRVTSTVVSSEARDWRGCAWADYDNDGYLDLFVTSASGNGPRSENELFRNNGDGTFAKLTKNQVGDIVSLDAGGSEGAAWADYDRDGFLDLFIAKYGKDWLYHNNGDDTFTQITNSAVGLVEDNQDSYAAMWGDYDNDGYPDLFVSVKSDSGLNQANFLYHNQRNGTFARATNGSIATDSEHSVGCFWLDYDNDGFLDLFAVNGGAVSGTNSLYHNNGDGSFTKATSDSAGSIVGDPGFFSGSTWGDFDNDGFVDVCVTEQFSEKNRLYHNNGDGTFTRVASRHFAQEPSLGVGCAWGDYDNDGFLDLFIARGNDVQSAVNLLYRNNGNSNGWVKIKLTGTVSNRSAIGARIRLRATIRGKACAQLREITAGNGICGSPLDAHFGLGDAANIDTLRIEWPSGTVQELHNVASKQLLTITEPPRLLAGKTNGTPQFALKGGRGFNYQIDTSTNLTAWSSLGVVTITNQNGTVRIIDINIPATDQRFYRAVSQ